MKKLLIFILSMWAFASFGQYPFQRIFTPYQFTKTRVDSFLRVPLDTIRSAEAGSFAYTPASKRFWVKTVPAGTRGWTEVQGGVTSVIRGLNILNNVVRIGGPLDSTAVITVTSSNKLKITGGAPVMDSLLFTNGTAGENFLLRQRLVSLGFPVATIKPDSVNKNMAVDIMPTTATNYFGEGLAWLDVVDRDISAGVGNVRAARVGITDSSVQFGMRNFGLTKTPIHFVMDTYTAMKIGSDSAVYIGTLDPKNPGSIYKLVLKGGLYQTDLFHLNKSATTTFPTLGGVVPIANFIYTSANQGPAITMTGANSTGGFLNFYKTSSTNAGTPTGIAEYSDVGGLIMQSVDHLNTFRYAGYLKLVAEDTTNNSVISGWDFGNVTGGNFRDRFWVTSQTVVVWNPNSSLPSYQAPTVALLAPWQFYVDGKTRFTDTTDIGATSGPGLLRVAGTIYSAGKHFFDNTITTTGTTGAQTINKPSGTVNIAAAGTSVTVTNSFCTTSSIVYCVVRTNDATAYIRNVVPGSGSFVVTLGAAATGEVSIGFIVYN